MILKPTTIYVSLNGDVLEQSRTSIYRYSDINEIRLVSPLAVEGGMRVNFLLSNGVTIEQKVMTALTEKETYDDEEWNVWSYRPTNVITATLTAQSVTTLQLSFTQITVVEGKTFGNTFGTATLSVNPTIEGPEPTLEDATALDQLQTDITALNTALGTKVDEDLDYPVLTVTDEDESFVYVYYNGGSYKVSLQQWIDLVNTQFTTFSNRLSTLEENIDQDVSIGSNPAFASPTVTSVNFLSNGQTSTIDFADAQAVNATAGHIDDGTIHFTKGSIEPSDIGLGNVENTSDADKGISTATQEALDDKQDQLVSGTDIKTINNASILASGDLELIATSEKGAVNGVATLNGDGKVPAAQLPAFVDDLEEYANKSEFPPTGDSDKIYVALDTNKIFRFSGTIYVEIAANEVNSVNGETGIVTLTATNVGLGNVTNESKATMFTDPTFTGTVSGVTATHVGLGNVTDNAQVTDVTATAPIESTGGTTPVISIVPATDSVAGSMSAADKTKLDALDGSTLDTDTTNFDGILSTDEDTIQKALDVLDDINAANIPFDNDGFNLVATNVQTALGEIDGLVEEGLTQVVVTKFEITAADDGTGGFTFTRNDEIGITGTFDTGKFVFTLPSGIEYVTGGNRLVVKIDGSDGALKRLFYGADEELSEPSDTTFAIDFALVTGDILYAKLFQSLATVSLDIADNSITQGKIADGAVSTTKIANNNVTLAKVEQIPTNTILGNDTVNTTNVKALTAAETKVLLELDQVNNSTDLNKPISTNTQTALDLKAAKTNVLEKNNTTEFTPTTDFEPATKKYVDDEVAEIAIGAFDDIADVNVANALDGDIVVYDDAAGAWITGQLPENIANLIEVVQANGTPLAITDKTVNVTRDSLGAALTNTFTSTIATTDTWTDTSGIFTLSKTGGTLTGLLSTDNPIADLELSAIVDVLENVPLIQAAWSLIYRIEITDDSVEYYATAEPVFPEDTDIQFKVVR